MFTVFNIWEDGLVARGLSLAEAFARVMALAERDYSFERTGDEMVLKMTRTRMLPRLPFPDAELDRRFNPSFRSAKLEDAEARNEIMAAVISAGFDGYSAVPDERFDEIAA